MLKIEMECVRGVLFIRLYGSLNKNTCSKLYEEVSELIFDNGIKNIIFNLENLTDLDINGINTLIYNYKLCKQNNGNTYFCGTSEVLEKKLDNKIFPLELNELTALGKFKI